MHIGDWDDGSGWWWLTMVIMMVAFWGAVIFLVAMLVRRSTSAPGGQPSVPASSAPPGPTALDVLAERFARGEIDQEEFRQRRDALREQ